MFASNKPQLFQSFLLIGQLFKVDSFWYYLFPATGNIACLFMQYWKESSILLDITLLNIYWIYFQYP